MSTPIGIAVVGCGWAGTRHAHACDRCGAAVRWLIDVDPRRAEALHKRLGPSQSQARVATAYHDALADPEVQAFDICLPHAHHAEVAVAAAQAGKHVLCEKPIADSLEAADRMIEAAERAGRILMIAENVRFEPLYLKVRELLDAGVIGRPALLQMTRETYLTRSFLEDRPWFLDRKLAAGGIMMSGGVHDFETMRMLIGDVESVYALQARQRFQAMQGDDTSTALIKFRDGAVGTLVESFIMKSLLTAAGSEVYSLRLDGDLGSLVTGGVLAPNPRTIRIYSERPGMTPEATIAQQDIYVPEADTFAREISHFLACIQGGSDPLTSGRAQRRPLEIVLAAYASMRHGSPVALPSRA